MVGNRFRYVNKTPMDIIDTVGNSYLVNHTSLFKVIKDVGLYFIVEIHGGELNQTITASISKEEFSDAIEFGAFVLINESD